MKAFRLLILPLLAVISLSCSQEAEEEATEVSDHFGPGEVAIVDGERIPESVFRLYSLLAHQVNADDLTPEGRNQFIEELVYYKVLASEAERQGLDQERRIAAEMELQRLQYLARAMSQRFAEENPPTESELRELYQQNLPRLLGTEYKTRHILVDSEAEATDLIEQIKQGTDFAELAREHSTDTATASEGGDLGWSSADGWVEPFGEAVRAATPGVLVETPVESQFGWHVILVEEKKDQVPPGLESLREELTTASRNQKLDSYANELREAAEVTIVGE